MHANPNAPIKVILTLAAFGAAAFWWWSLRRLRQERRFYPVWALGLLMLAIPPLAAWTLSSLWLHGPGAQASNASVLALAASVFGLQAVLPRPSRLQLSSRVASRAQSGFWALMYTLSAILAFLRWLAPDILNPWLGALLLVGASVSLLLALSTRARAWLWGLWNPSAH
jgi:hypothetical protein